MSHPFPAPSRAEFGPAEAARLDGPIAGRRGGRRRPDDIGRVAERTVVARVEGRAGVSPRVRGLAALGVGRAERRARQRVHAGPDRDRGAVTYGTWLVPYRSAVRPTTKGAADLTGAGRAQ